MIKTFLSTDDSPATLIIRLALGIVMFPHGAQKVFGWFGGPGFAQTIQTFQGMGFPAWSTVILMIIECLGALLLILGVFTRLWALGIGTTIFHLHAQVSHPERFLHELVRPAKG